MSFSILLVMFLEHCTEHWKLYRFDNEKRTIHTKDFIEDNKYSVEFEIVYNGQKWLVRGVTNVAKFDN